MKQRLIIIAAIAGAAFFGAIAANLVAAQQSRPQVSSDLDRAAIEQIVRDTIKNDPAIIVDALNAYAENHVKDTARKYLSDFASGKSGHVGGKNVNAAKVVVVEFFDYHCGFCKRSAGFVQNLLKADPAVKVAFREYPILREESELASRYALAARAQGKYQDLHFAMLNHSGVLSEKAIIDIAGKVGLDVKRLEKEAKNPSFTAIIDADRRAGQEMNIDGTPTFIVATLDGSFVEFVPGFRPEDLQAAIAEAKKKR